MSARENKEITRRVGHKVGYSGDHDSATDLSSWSDSLKSLFIPCWSFITPFNRRSMVYHSMLIGQSLMYKVTKQPADSNCFQGTKSALTADNYAYPWPAGSSGFQPLINSVVPGNNEHGGYRSRTRRSRTDHAQRAAASCSADVA